MPNNLDLDCDGLIEVLVTFFRLVNFWFDVADCLEIILEFGDLLYFVISNFSEDWRQIYFNLFFIWFDDGDETLFCTIVAVLFTLFSIFWIEALFIKALLANYWFKNYWWLDYFLSASTVYIFYNNTFYLLTSVMILFRSIFFLYNKSLYDCTGYCLSSCNCRVN